MRVHGWLTAVILAAALAVPGGVGATGSEGDRGKDADRTDQEQARTERAGHRAGDEATADDSEPIVITNDILEERYGSGRAGSFVSGEVAADGRPADGSGSRRRDADPVKALLDRQARERSRQAAIEQAQQEVSAAEEKVRRLEKRALAVRNPLMPRPQLDPEEAGEWESMSSVERLEKTRQDIEAANAELEEARKKLAELRSGA